MRSPSSDARAIAPIPCAADPNNCRRVTRLLVGRSSCNMASPPSSSTVQFFIRASSASSRFRIARQIAVIAACSADVEIRILRSRSRSTRLSQRISDRIDKSHIAGRTPCEHRQFAGGRAAAQNAAERERQPIIDAAGCLHAMRRQHARGFGPGRIVQRRQEHAAGCR